jgi:hypothetical protein
MLKIVEEEDSSSKELKSSSTPSKKNDGTSLSEIDRYTRYSTGNQSLLENLITA